MDVKTKQAKTVMLPIYRAGSLLLLPLAICLTFTFGCVTNVSPSLPEEVLKDENSCAEKTKISCGQLALTIGIEKQTFYANPSLEIEIIDLATGKSQHLIAPIYDLKEPRKGKRFSYQAFIYSLPIGRYKLSKSQLTMPPITKGGRDYNQLTMDAAIDLKNRLPELEVEASKVKHLLIAEISLKEVVGDRTLFYSSTTRSFYKKPYPGVWAKFDAELSKKEFYYYKVNKRLEGWQKLPRANEEESSENVEEDISLEYKSHFVRDK